MGVTVNPIGSATTDASELTSGTLDNARLNTGIDTTKLADGTVSNTEFQYLNGVTSNIQTQIDGIGGSFWDETQTLTTNSTLTDVTTATEVTGFSFDLEANSTYIYKGEILMDNGDVAVGLDMYMTNKNGDNLTNWAQNGFGVYAQTGVRQRSSESASLSSKFFFNESGGAIDAVSRCFVNGSFTTGDNTPEMILTAKLNGSSTGVLTFYKGSVISFKKVS